MHPRLRQGRRTTVGALLILALITLTATIFVLEDIKAALTDTYVIVGVFGELPALKPGNPVWIAGRPAGEVVAVDLMPHDSDSTKRLAVTLRIPSRYAPLIRRDSELGVATPRIVADAVINIMPGTTSAPQLHPGDTLVARPAWNLERTAARLATVRAELDSLRADAAVLGDRVQARRPELEAALQAVGSAGRELDALLGAYREGPLGTYLSDPDVRATLSSVQAAADEISALARARMDQLRDPEIAAALDRLGRRAALLREQVVRLRTMLEEPRGFLARWRQDPALRDALTGVQAQLDSLIAEARSRPWRFVF